MMKIYAKNGVYLGNLELEDKTILFYPRIEGEGLTEYMLEEALRIMKKLS